MKFLSQPRASNTCIVTCLLMVNEEYGLNEKQIWSAYFNPGLSCYSPYGIEQNFKELRCVKFSDFKNSCLPLPFLLNISPPGIISHFIVIKYVDFTNKILLANDPLGEYPYYKLGKGEDVAYSFETLAISTNCFAIFLDKNKTNINAHNKSYAIEDLSRNIKFRLENNPYAEQQLLSKKIKIFPRYQLLSRHDGFTVMRGVHEKRL